MKTSINSITFFVLSCLWTNAQTTITQKLIEMGFYPYDNIKSEIEYLDETLIQCKAIFLEDINENFTNIQDLDWLRDKSIENKVIFIGENHFNRYTQQLRNRILFALNTWDYYPVVIFEEPYAFTAYANYYLQLFNEEQATTFYEHILYEMITSKEEYELLQHIRRWNRSHPDKTISVGYRDIEKTRDELSIIINKIIVPFLRQQNPNLKIDWEVVLKGNFENLITEFRQYLDKARKINLVGEYPFITQQYISTVIDNLESSNNALYKDYHIHRQKAIIRNLTDTSYLGKYLQNGKIIIQGGSWHSGTRVVSDSVNNLWEGGYFTNVFEQTKSKTYSIRIDAIARSLGEASNTGSSYIEPGLGYRGLLEKMQKAYQDGLIKPADCYFVSIYGESLNDYYKLWIQKGKGMNNQGLLIDTISLNNTIELISSKESERAESFIKIRNENELFDNVIIIPCSPLITPTMKK